MRHSLELHYVLNELEFSGNTLNCGRNNNNMCSEHALLLNSTKNVKKSADEHLNIMVHFCM